MSKEQLVTVAAEQLGQTRFPPLTEEQLKVIKSFPLNTRQSSMVKALFNAREEGISGVDVNDLVKIYSMLPPIVSKDRAMNITTDSVEGQIDVNGKNDGTISNVRRTIYSINEKLKQAQVELIIVGSTYYDPKAKKEKYIYSIKTYQEVKESLDISDSNQDYYTNNDVLRVTQDMGIKIDNKDVIFAFSVVKKRNPDLVTYHLDPKNRKRVYYDHDIFKKILDYLVYLHRLRTSGQQKNQIIPLENGNKPTNNDLVVQDTDNTDAPAENPKDDLGLDALEQLKPTDEEIEKLERPKTPKTKYPKTEPTWRTPEEIIGINSVYKVLLSLEQGTLPNMTNDIPTILTSAVKEYPSRVIKELSDVFIDTQKKRLERFFRVFFLSILEYWDLDPEKATTKPERAFSQLFKALKDKLYTKEQVAKEVLVDHFGLKI